MQKTLSLKTLPVLIFSLSLLGCGDTDNPLGGDCNDIGADAGADLQALLDSVNRFSATATAMDADVIAACNGIATDLGAQAGEDADTACANAQAALETINAKISGSATLTVEYQAPVCRASVSATVDCVASCDVDFDATATPPTCEGGMLSGMCTGACEGTCTAEASVACEARCEGSCSGSCDARVTGACTGTCNGNCDGECSAMDGDGNCAGTCDGTCSGTCEGSIEGSCSGTCSGTCSAGCQAEVDGTCEGTCTGSCDVDFVAPTCEGGEVNVMADAECQAACETDASLTAECTEPSITVAFSAAGDTDLAGELATLQATLQANLPKLLAVAARGEAIVDNTADFAGKLGAAASSAVDLGVTASACFASAVTAQAEAFASVSASVSVSVSVSAEATATTN